MQDFCFNRKAFDEEFVSEKHVNYLLRLLKKSISGTQFDAAEVHRLSSLFFIVSGLDLLGALDNRLTNEDKKEIIDWIYSYHVDVDLVKFDTTTTPPPPPLQSEQPQPSTNLEQEDEEITNTIEETKAEISTKAPKTSQTTFDDTKIFLSKSQRRVARSGFRATSMIDSDIPFDCGVIPMTYCALASLVILGDDLKRVDRESIIAGIKLLQLDDGSFEPSALGGENDMRIVYCAVATSAILNDWSGLDRDKCAKFIKASLSYEGAFAQCPGAEAHGGSTYCALASLKLMSKLEETLNQYEISQLIRWCSNRLDSGFSGRPNKDQDTCYSFWIGACLVMLNQFQCVDQKRLIQFVLQAQEERGGLSKVPAFYPDPLHTYLGLAGLTFIDEDLRLEKKDEPFTPIKSLPPLPLKPSSINAKEPSDPSSFPNHFIGLDELEMQGQKSSNKSQL